MKEYGVARMIEDVYLGHHGVNLIHFSLSTPMDDPALCVPPRRALQAWDVFVTEISRTEFDTDGSGQPIRVIGLC
ncbi:MAG: hypothetical protein WB239_15140 [Acidimicrobiia bacterium]